MQKNTVTLTWCTKYYTIRSLSQRNVKRKVTTLLCITFDFSLIGTGNRQPSRYNPLPLLQGMWCCLGSERSVPSQSPRSVALHISNNSTIWCLISYSQWKLYNYKQLTIQWQLHALIVDSNECSLRFFGFPSSWQECSWPVAHVAET